MPIHTAITATFSHGTARLLTGIRDLIAISSHQRNLAIRRPATGTGATLVRGLAPPATSFRDLHNSRHYAQHHRLQVAVPPKPATLFPLLSFFLPRQFIFLDTAGEVSSVDQRRNHPASRRGLDSYQRIPDSRRRSCQKTSAIVCPAFAGTRCRRLQTARLCFSGSTPAA